MSFLFLTQKTNAQNVSNEGTEFWAVFPTHVPSGSSYASMSIFISSKNNSSGVITVGGQTYPFSVQSNSIAEVNIPREFAYISDNEAGKVTNNKGIHIVVDAGKPKVAAYAHIYARARSEAYLILPIEAHGKRYFAMDTFGLSAPNQSNESKVSGKAFMVILATADNTVVNIREQNSKTTKQITLPKTGDVYEVLSDVTLSGAEIEIDNPTNSCKTFAVYSGHSGLALYNGSYDPLAQQLYPVQSWGKVYGVVPFTDRNYFVKLIASEDNTQIKINGQDLLPLDKGGTYESPPQTEFLLISSDKPISAAQFTFSQSSIAAPPNSGTLGDPDMVMLNPIEYSIKNITVFSSDLENISQKYLNIFMKTKYRETFMINGFAPKGVWKTVDLDPSYSYLQERVIQRSLTLTANDTFNAIAYGFGEFESYAYSAGTNLAANQFLLLQNRVTNQETSAACLGQPSDFKLTLPYLLKRILWKLEDGTIIYDDTNPSVTKEVTPSGTVYRYFSPVNMTFSSLKQYRILAVGTLAQTTDNCYTGDVDLNFTIDVDPLPQASFDAQTSGCADEELTFTDKSTSNVQERQITKWLWDFGDGQVSTAQNPKHTYASSGQFTITLMAGAESGCLSNAETKQITIKQKVNALFDSPNNVCAQANILFTDKSHMNIGTIAKWTWDMGDGKSPLVKNSSAPFSYKFDAPGKYIVSLIAQGSNGCISLAFTKEITVYALPTNDFELPEVCVNDGKTTFKNLSTNVDGTPIGLTYLWNFDDPASGINNTSTNVDGLHQFTVARDYNITLTVTNENGCVLITTKKFTVNGANPLASFTTTDGEICSNQSFTATNTSAINFGKMTRIEWYIDDVLYSTDEEPTNGKTYTFNYPEFTSPSTKTIKLKMIAYSGSITGPCNAAVVHDVILKASPQIEFDAQQPLCLNAKPIQLTARELGSIPGNGVFSGNGVSSDGVFNPMVAGVGDAIITYTFSATNGCMQNVEQLITVYPIPTVYAGKDEYILVGGERKLEGTATGRGLTYKWSPSVGLDRDDILNPTVKPDEDTNYTLTVTSKDGCVVSDQIYVHLLREFNPPNTISPNGDSVNDVWNIKYLDSYPKVTVEIFNRNGQKVYLSRGYSVPFDGNFNNQALPVGTYYYIINPNNGGKSFTGNLTIIR